MKRLTVIAIGFSLIVGGSLLAQPVDATGGMKYLVGLGDSRAAGGGLPAHSDESPSRYDAACERSPYASIAYLANATSTPVVNYSCVGATTDDLYSSGRFNKTRVPSQISQIEDYVLTDEGTVFIIQTGANDMKWKTVLARCARTECGAKKRDDVAVKILIKNYERRMNKAIMTLRKKGAEGRIVLAGLYTPIPSDAAVLEKHGITRSERTWIEGAIRQFNDKSEEIADKHNNVDFAPIYLGDSDIQMMDDPMPFHPTISGQQSVARQLEAVIDSRL